MLNCDEGGRVPSGSRRCALCPATRSAESPRSAIMPGISAGSSCKSPSSVAIPAPVDAANPADRAADLPKLRRRRRPRIRGSCPLRRTISFQVPSVLPSSMKMSSHPWPAPSAPPSMAALTSSASWASEATSSLTGTSRDTSTTAGSPTVSWVTLVPSTLVMGLPRPGSILKMINPEDDQPSAFIVDLTKIDRVPLGQPSQRVGKLCDRVVDEGDHEKVVPLDFGSPTLERDPLVQPLLADPDDAVDPYLVAVTGQVVVQHRGVPERGVVEHVARARIGLDGGHDSLRPAPEVRSVPRNAPQRPRDYQCDNDDD